jgi:hypothetical protein
MCYYECMSSTLIPGPAARPTVVDYLVLLAGAGLSFGLIKLSPFTVDATDNINQSILRYAVPYLPCLLRLPEGIVLLLPVFLLIQLVRGRRESLTAAEWLWLVLWFGTALLTVLGGCERFNLLPEFVRTHLLLVRFVWYVGFDLAVALLAAVLIVVGLFRPTAPWTHQLALALAVWPVAPLAGILTLSKLFG